MQQDHALTHHNIKEMTICSLLLLDSTTGVKRTIKIALLQNRILHLSELFLFLVHFRLQPSSMYINLIDQIWFNQGAYWLLKQLSWLNQDYIYILLVIKDVDRVSCRWKPYTRNCSSSDINNAGKFQTKTTTHEFFQVKHISVVVLHDMQFEMQIKL